MTSPATPQSDPVASEPTARRRRPWFGLALAAVLWLQTLVGWALDVQSFAWFLGTMALYAVVTIAFIVWWLSRRSFTWPERVTGLVAAPLLGILVGRLAGGTIQPVVYLALIGLPIVLTAWAIWVWIVAPRPGTFRVGSLVACLALVWGAFLLVRVNGIQGNMRADIHWRWTPTAEQLYLAGRPAKPLATTAPATNRALTLRPGDWPGFRGPDRDGVVHGLSINLDWDAHPPKVLWRQRVGPAWSSMSVVDGRVFTQEQRGEREAAVCRDADTGSEVWSHEDASRFDEPMSGPGPRATPTFADGRLYTQGARGNLDCLDAATGRPIWTRNVATDSGAAAPIFGCAGSPLVLGDKVIVLAGTDGGKKGLLAYPLDGGPPAWTADVGKMTYSSPQRFTFGNDDAVLVFSTSGLLAVDPATGKPRWDFPMTEAVGVPPAIQPCRTAPDTFVIGYGAGFGTEAVRLAPDGHAAPSKLWATQKMKPSYNDMVLHKGFLYGFDGTVFCCLDAATGNRRWRSGRYGGGQVILLADQGVMIVSTEEGEAVLLRCNPDRHEELARIPVITGKAWNHPAIAQNRLYLRSDAELACLELNRSK
jgi:outer membrane protein assembly factor BamB